MSKILKSLQLVTQSASPSTPSTGTGALFGSGSSFYFENSSGTVFDLAASNGYIVTRSYTGSTTGVDVPYTWSKSPNLKYLEICCVGGGGGGGSGRCSATNNVQTMTGGGGGAIVYLWIEASRLTNSPYTITVGRGGTPGAARVATGTAVTGNTGSSGGDTSFGSLVVAKGGSGGSHSSFALGGRADQCTPSQGIWTIPGVPSGTATNAGNQTGDSQPIFSPTGDPSLNSNPLWQTFTNFGNGGAAGGVGGLLTTLGSNGVPLTRGFSGSVVQSGVIPGNGLGGSAGGVTGSGNTSGGNGQNGLDNIVTKLFPLSGSSPYGLGTGGGGGAGARVFPGNGGNGGYYGAGGGAGGQLAGLGSVLIPSSSGAGGSGSSGLCLLIEYY